MKKTAAPVKKKNIKKPKKKISNDNARIGYYNKLTVKAAEKEHFQDFFAKTARTTTFNSQQQYSKDSNNRQQYQYKKYKKTEKTKSK